MVARLKAHSFSNLTTYLLFLTTSPNEKTSKTPINKGSEIQVPNPNIMQNNCIQKIMDHPAVRNSKAVERRRLVHGNSPFNCYTFYTYWAIHRHDQ